MQRYFIYLSYLGENYHGWQIQPNENSIQAEIEKVISIILQKEIAIVGAGRTDAGVHAKYMVAHFDSDKKWDKNLLKHKLNTLLPQDISVFDIKKVKQDAHARFDAIYRTYNYIISPRKNAFLYKRAFKFTPKLDVVKMNAAAQLLLGEKDFSCFSKSKTQTYTNYCNIITAEWKWEDDLLVFTITANRFLRHMVRAIVGTLIEVGEGKRTIEDIPLIIKQKKRSNAGTSVLADGLYLCHIEYPKNCFINEA